MVIKKNVNFCSCSIIHFKFIILHTYVPVPCDECFALEIWNALLFKKSGKWSPGTAVPAGAVRSSRLAFFLAHFIICGRMYVKLNDEPVEEVDCFMYLGSQLADDECTGCGTQNE